MRRYQARLSGPLLDRIDMQMEVPALKPSELMAMREASAGASAAFVQESSAIVAARVRDARERQLARQGQPNALLSTSQLDAELRLTAAARDLLVQVADKLGWSARGLHRVSRVARTLADMEGAAAIAPHHMAEAVQYRRGMAAAA